MIMSDFYCPYCNEEHEADWENGEGETFEECGACGKQFLVVAELSMSHSEYPLGKIEIIKPYKDCNVGDILYTDSSHKGQRDRIGWNLDHEGNNHTKKYGDLYFNTRDYNIPYECAKFLGEETGDE